MEKLLKLLLGFVFIIVVGALVMKISEEADSKSRAYKEDNLRGVRDGNEQIAKKNDLLRVKIESMREDPRAMERKIRDEFWLIRSDEIVVYIRDENGKLADWGKTGAEQRLIRASAHDSEEDADASDGLNINEVFPDVSLGEDDQRENLPLAPSVDDELGDDEVEE